MNYITKDQATEHLNNDVTILDIDINVSYDLDLARIYLNDFLNGCNGYGIQNINNDYLIIYENEKLKNERYYNIDELEKMDIDELITLLDNLENYYYDTDDKDCLIDSLLQYTNEDYYEKHCQSSRWYDLESNFTISGYSQGDAIAVKLVGDVSITEDYLSNLFFDVPVYGSIEVYNKRELLAEIYIYEYLEDSYTWDKVQVINNISNAYLNEDYHALLIEYLIENLPEDLDYI